MTEQTAIITYVALQKAIHLSRKHPDRTWDKLNEIWKNFCSVCRAREIYIAKQANDILSSQGF